MPGAKNWCFTWNNYPPTWKNDIKDAIQNMEQQHNIKIIYIVAGQEVGQQGTPHLQGFISIDKRITNPAQRLWQAHWTIAKHVQRAIEYCKKGDQSSEEWNTRHTDGPNYGTNAQIWQQGVMPDKRGVQGKRTDLHELRQAIATAFENGETYTEKDARNDFPNTAAQYPLFVKQSIKDYKPIATVPVHPLKPWQAELNNKLNLPANDRDVIFVVDPIGNSGKTWFSKYYRQNHERVQLIPPGKYADMAYLVDENTRVFFVDTPREKVEYFNYYFLEKLKDRDVFSSKYYPEHKEMLHKVHVVVLMNTDPDMTKLSADRYIIIRT